MDAILPGLDAAPNVHPMLVHFPLALWPVALAFMAVAYLKAKDELFGFATLLLYGGVLSGVAAAVAGWFAADALGHDQPGHSLVHDHRNFMLAALAIATLAAGAAHWARLPERRTQRWVPLGLVLLACLLSVLGADRGGLLVYGYGVGVKTSPSAHVTSTQASMEDKAHSH